MNSNEMDQQLANVRDTLPRFWYALYQGNRVAGFNNDQALILLQTYILAQSPSGINVPKATDTPNEE